MEAADRSSSTSRWNCRTPGASSTWAWARSVPSRSRGSRSTTSARLERSSGYEAHRSTRTTWTTRRPSPITCGFTRARLPWGLRFTVVQRGW
eukprot:2786101-Pleurochrysis_carterae.AAC.1